MNSHEVFIHIHKGCFAGTGAIVRLPQCQWSKPDGYGNISQCITTTKHSKAKTVCIFLGIYCISFYRLFNSCCIFKCLFSNCLYFKKKCIWNFQDMYAFTAPLPDRGRPYIFYCYYTEYKCCWRVKANFICLVSLTSDIYLLECPPIVRNNESIPLVVSTMVVVRPCPHSRNIQ